MDVYKQDETIPIYIYLQYGLNILQFPINPDCIKKEIPSDSTSAEIEGIGEIAKPSGRKLASISIKSFFWSDIDVMPPAFYVEWLERWQRSKKPARLVVTRLNYSMNVICDSFNHWINAGEEKDIYFELRLKEYRKYGAKVLKAETNPTELQKFWNSVKDFAEAYESSEIPLTLFPIPRPLRGSETHEPFSNPYVTIEGDTLASITKKITGSTEDWEQLYTENAETLGDAYMNDGTIEAGTSLTLPDSWVNNSDYNIENSTSEGQQNE